MATVLDLMRAFGIFLKYDAGHCETVGERFYAPAGVPEDVGPEDRKQLEALNWYWDEEAEGWYTFT